MTKRFLISFTILALFGTGLRCQETVPLKLVQTFQLSPQVKGNFDHFGIDLKGGRLFATPEGYHAVVVFDLKTGKLLETNFVKVSDVEWVGDNKTLFYVTEDAQTKRANQAHRHVLGEDPAKDEVVYEEKDPRFDLSLRRSRSRDFVVMTSASMTIGERKTGDSQTAPTPSSTRWSSRRVMPRRSPTPSPSES